MACVNNVLEVIGRTPLVRLARLGEGLTSPLYAKMEMLNPGYSVRDRTALAMVIAAEREGLLKPGGTIIEASSGNTGVGFALAAAVKGYRLIVVMPDKMSRDKVKLLRAYGAEVVIATTNVSPNSSESYTGVAARLAREIPNAWQPNPFADPANSEAHYLTTGPEVWDDTAGQVGVFVAEIGTGGTISGVGRYLKERNPSITIVGVDPEGTVLSGDNPKTHPVEDLREHSIPPAFDRQVVDKMVRISDRESFHMARRLAREEGILAGGSCGAALAAALLFAKSLCQPRTIVVLLPDSGRNYLSTVFDDEWLREKGLWEAPTERMKTLAWVLSEKRSLPGLIAVGPRERLRRAIWLMQNYNISQLPVLERRHCVGSVNEAGIMKLLHDGLDCDNQEIAPVMGRPFPMLPQDTPVSEAYRILSGNGSGIVVTRADQPVGLVTRSDLIVSWLKLEPMPDRGPWGNEYAI